MSENDRPTDNAGLPEHTAPRPWPHAIRSQLNRILVQPYFVAREDQAKLLSYLVEHAQSAPFDERSSATIARHIFDADDSDDRNPAARLRETYAALREALLVYYGYHGRNDPVIFTLPEETIGIEVTANDILLDQDEIDAEAEQSAVLPRNQPVNFYAIVAAFLMAIAGAVYFIGLDRSTQGPIGPATLTDVGPTGQRLYSLAVLPFKDVSTRSPGPFLAATTTTEVISRLGRERRLRVIAPNTSRASKLPHEPSVKTAESVKVRYLLSGELARNNGTVHLNLGLFDTDSESTVWRQTYDYSLDKVGVVYGSISKAISKELNTKNNEPEILQPQNQQPARDHVEDAITVKEHAYLTYLKARDKLNEGTPNALAQAITLFRASISTDPGLPRAHSGLAAGLARLAGYGFERISPKQSLRGVKEAVVGAMRLNEFYAEPYIYLGEFRTVFERDWAGAERVFVYAIQFNPSDAVARRHYSRFLEARRQQQDAINQAERSHILDPLSPETHANRAWQYLQAAWLSRAREHFEEIVKRYPRDWRGHWGLGHYHWRRGDLEDAVSAFRRATNVDPDNTRVLASLGHVLARARHTKKAQNVLSEIKKIASVRYVSPLHVAMIHAGLGETDKTFKQIEKAVAIRAHGLAWLNVTKEFDSVRDDPRFTRLLQRLNLDIPPAKTAKK